MKKKRRSFIKTCILQTLFLFSFTKTHSDQKFRSKKILNKRVFKRFVWYLDKNDK